MLMNSPEDYYEIPSNNLYPGNERTNNHDQQKQKMTTKPTRLVVPSQECVGKTRQGRMALQYVTDTRHPLQNVLNRKTKKDRFGQVSMIPPK